MLLPSYVEVRDKGIVKKKIRIHGKSFEYVLGELEKYFRSARKILRPGLLEEVLIKIGLPEADIILPSGQTPTQKEERKTEPTVEKPTEEAEEKPKPVEKEDGREEKDTSTIPKADEEIVGHTIQKIEEIHESSPQQESQKIDTSETPVFEEKKPGIRINIRGVEDIVASSKTHVTVPVHKEDEQEVEEDEVSETDADLETSQAEVEVPYQESIEIDMTEEGETLDTVEQVITEVEETNATDTAVIRPIKEAKALILGEDVVGRATLLSTAGFEPVHHDDEIPYHFKRIIKMKENRVALDVWSFDEAVKAGIKRKEFYDSPDVALIVYSVVDRWSFESITYWLKEIAITNEILPPIVIVGNKKDLRTESNDDVDENPISEQEGFDYAEELATTLAHDGTLHPVAFIETSCITEEKVIDAFTIAADLYIKNQDD